MNEIEIWKDVKDYEGIYQILSTGKIRNLKTKKELSLNKSNAGYLRTVISKKDSKPKHVLIHRLVLETFAPCANMNNLQVNHIDENKLNNCLSNLEWCTHEYNNNFGTKKERVSLKLQKPVRCIETGEIFASESLAARAKNINQTAISNCCIHKVVKSKGYVYETHTAGGYHWEFYKKEGD